MGQYKIRLINSMSEVQNTDWNALLGAEQVFTRWEFLMALESSVSVDGKSGWHSMHLLLEKDDQLVAAMPGYLKDHSYGEYVFDWAWADAYQRAGMQYYPKWLCAIPFSPIPGARLLGEAQHHPALAQAWVRATQQMKLSSAHCLLASDDQLSILRENGALLRQGVQFHWKNRHCDQAQGAQSNTTPYLHFEEFLAQLTQSKRKKIRAERRKVEQAGVTIQVLEGEQIGEADWDFFYRCYVKTYREHRSTPYLTRAFFQQISELLPNNCVLVIASLDARVDSKDQALTSLPPIKKRLPIAAALLLRDDTALYGRYWGAIEHIDCLHFELAYYTPIEWAISKQLKRIEGGAQGEHKLARGFLPVTTGSAHWIAHEGFRHAVADFLQHESESMQAYGDELNDRSPFQS